MSDAVTDAIPQAEPAKPTLWQQVRAWITTGTQSVGGGPSTLYLMRAIIVGRGWLTEREFFQEWTLSRLSPGNHLTALAALLGQRLGGARGVLLAMAGLLVPSAIITIALTGGFEFIRDDPAVTAALAGVGPVTIGMMLGISAIMLRSVVRSVLPGAAADAALFVAAMIAGFLIPEATIIVIVTGALIGVAFMGQTEIPPETVEQ
ncbi:MAG TPA: chromate transporter [Candidatus Limnocylindria bacterium]|nr:chromate transporter [Candidatus Limnocylindria bacterium]